MISRYEHFSVQVVIVTVKFVNLREHARTQKFQHSRKFAFISSQIDEFDGNDHNLYTEVFVTTYHLLETQ